MLEILRTTLKAIQAMLNKCVKKVNGITPDADGNVDIKVSWQEVTGKPTISEGTGTASIKEGLLTKASGPNSHAEGESTTASGYASHAEGFFAEASGNYSHAEGSHTTASGNCSHAEGQGTKASEDFSHAEGSHTTASGNCSHAEGDSTTASEWSAHAEGYNTTASAWNAHAEGYNTTASGLHSHAGGYGTIAKGDNQTAIGKYNIEDTSNKYAFIVGNGTSSTRKNAFTVDWSGNVEANGKKLATEEYVNTNGGKIDSISVNGSAQEIVDKNVNITIPEQIDYTVTITESTPEGFAKVYNIKQTSTGLNATINIPKDMVVSSGKVETYTLSGEWGLAGTYLVLTLANATSDKVYINVGNLIEYVTSGSTAKDQIQIKIDDEHKVTAALKNSSVTKKQLDTKLQNELNSKVNAEYVEQNGSKITKILVNGVEQTINEKSVNLDVPTNSEFNTHVNNSNIHITAAERTKWSEKYNKPSSGIPKTDLASAVQTSLEKADTALQAHQDISGKADKNLSNVDNETFKAKVEANVDLTNFALKPTITTATLLVSNWDSTAKTYSFETDYPNTSYDIEVALDSTATAEQAEAFNGAQIVGSATSNIIKAYGDVPTVDIPIILKVVRK